MDKNLFNIDPDRIYTVDEIADILRFSRQTITKDIRAGEIACAKLGRHTYRIQGAHLLEYLNKRFKEVKK